MALSQIRFYKKFLGSLFFGDAVYKDIHKEQKNKITTKFEVKDRICDSVVMQAVNKTYDPNNIFARIIRGELPSKKIYEDENILAFEDINPEAPIHILIIPKGKFKNFDDFVNIAEVSIVAKFFAKISEIARDLGIDKSGYRLITNHGIDACQSVSHFHVHLLAGKNLGSLISKTSN